MSLNPVTQYQTDHDLRARQRLWEHQRPPFDLVAWVLDLASVASSTPVLDVRCGNGAYLRELQVRGITAVGLDLSLGMLRSDPPQQALISGDASKLPVRSPRSTPFWPPTCSTTCPTGRPPPTSSDAC